MWSHICLHHKKWNGQDIYCYPILVIISSLYLISWQFLTYEIIYCMILLCGIIWNFEKVPIRINKYSLVIYALMVIFTSLNFHRHILYFFYIAVALANLFWFFFSEIYWKIFTYMLQYCSEVKIHIFMTNLWIKDLPWDN